jgi:hypothetical protein
LLKDYTTGSSFLKSAAANKEGTPLYIKGRSR